MIDDLDPTTFNELTRSVETRLRHPNADELTAKAWFKLAKAEKRGLVIDHDRIGGLLYLTAHREGLDERQGLTLKGFDTPAPSPPSVELREYLESLPADQRQIVTLWLAGHSFHKMGVPHTTAWRQFRFAIKSAPRFLSDLE